MSGAVGGGRRAAEAGEDAAEMGGVGNADGIGDFFHGGLAGEEQILAALDAAAHEVIQGTDADDLFEAVGEISGIQSLILLFYF